MYTILICSIIVTVIATIGFIVSGVTSIIQAFASWPSVKASHIKLLHQAIIIFLIFRLISASVSVFLIISSKNTIAIASGDSSANTIPTATSMSTINSLPPTPIPTATSTPTTTLSTQPYSDPQPMCDKKGGQWSLQGIAPINCEAQAGTTPLLVNDAMWGYLYFNLPNNETFSANNEISINAGNLLTAAGGGASECVGLAEMGKNAGFLGVYCGNGTWSIYSTSNTGVIIRQLAGANIIQSQSVQMVLDMNTTTLSFSIDADGNRPHTLKIPLIKPVQIAIVASHTYITGGVLIQNFTYTDHSS